ncbi:hypothetical protein HEC73_21675 [Escherichia coli]|nr:hypothetical protein [Escherichia coli]MBV7133653.1 hypothetical protein [Escherichia coli]
MAGGLPQRTAGHQQRNKRTMKNTTHITTNVQPKSEQRPPQDEWQKPPPE